MQTQGIDFGAYSVTRELGRGGMGEVYRALDKRLDRDVAIKLLPERMSNDRERVQRFEREAKLLAALNHPNVGAIYGFEEAAGKRFLVLEFVEGESLRQRLKRGPMPIDEALETCRQVALALEAAHEKGIVHRDLKPGNVMLRPDGAVKVLDFGLARAISTDSAITLIGQEASPEESSSPTMTADYTQPGMILGTASYMSPEQARGRMVDKRTDIWSFGVLLYECLTGKQLFRGETTTDVLGAIVHCEPDWSLLPPATPPAIRQLLQRCLAQDRNRRLHDIADARIEIEGVQSGETVLMPAAVAAPAIRRKDRLGWAPWIVAALATGLAAWLGWRGSAPPPSRPVQFEITSPAGGRLDASYGMLAISPDGRRVVFPVKEANGDTRLWLRELDALDSRPLAGTEGGTLPFWAPDSRQLGFFRQDQLMKIAIDGGPARTVCAAPDGRGGTWNARGEILFAPTSAGVLSKVSADGGAAVEVTRLQNEPKEFGHRFPQFLPDGRRFVFGALPMREAGHPVYLGSLDSAEVKLLGYSDQGATWFEPGYLLLLREGALEAVAVDVRTGTPSGSPILTDMQPSGAGGYALAPVISASRAGAAAYAKGGATESTITRLGRNGAALGTIPNLRGVLGGPRVSPDGLRMVVERTNARLNDDLWEIDIQRGTGVRLTSAWTCFAPVWSKDGRWIVFSSDRGEYRDLYRVPAGGGPEERVLDSDSMFVTPTDIMPDGSGVIFSRLDAKNGRDLWAIALAPDARPTSILATPFHETHGRVSPDGRRLAYVSDESGRPEVYLRSLTPEGGGKRQVSTTGGGDTRSTIMEWVSWRADGLELTFLSSDSRVVYSVDVTPGESLQVSEPKELFKLPVGAIGFCAAPDHESFYVLTPVDAAAGSIVVTTDWQSRLKRGSQ